MPQLPELSLQQSVYDILSQDVNLSALANGIYENPPANVYYPYITFGQTQSADWSTKTTSGVQSLLTLHIYSQESRKEVLMIRDRIAELLYPGALDMPGFNLVVMRFEQHDIDLENDGITFHGVLRYRAFIENIAA